VVVGDDAQLPPAGFVVTESAAESTPVAGQSVLTTAAGFLPVVQLRQHYRSLDERLISFVNHQIYNNQLITWPARASDSPVRFEQVDGRGVLSPGDEAVESTDAEVQRVVELVLEHAQSRPQESLGVIALGARHASRVDHAVRLALAEQPQLSAQLVHRDRFFVKQVDHVQGDERDAVIVTVGFGRTPHGKILHRFGGISGDSGGQRMAVAASRARQRLTVVAAFAATDIDLTRTSAPGVRRLRDFLAYAAAESAAGVGSADSAIGSVAEAAEALAGPPADPLLADLMDRLRHHELRVRAGAGDAPAQPDLLVGPLIGAPVVAVDVDGSRYASRVSVRERDRLRPQELRRRGWHHVQIWSTDIFRDPDREVARVLGALEGRPV
jgi:hypothetical protein